jgi:hypothetical protein
MYYSKALAGSRAVLRVLVVLNLLGAAMIVAVLLFSLLFEAAVVEDFRRDGIGPDPLMVLKGLRVMALVGLAMIPLMHIVLTRLLAMVDTVRRGDAFVAANAARLNTIAWALLGVQLLDLLFGAMADELSSHHAEIEWTFSLTGWVAVLLLFVLAKVFEDGARMRDDLEGTV